MKFSCEKYLLLQAASIAARAAASKSAIPALEGILIEAENDRLTISGYDLKTGIRTSVDADVGVSGQGSVVLNARLFCEIIRKLPDDVVNVEVDSSLNAKIKCGYSKFNIMGFSSADYPELPGIEKSNSIKMEQGILKSMIAETNFAVSDNEARPVHTGALFEIEGEDITVVAVDGFRMALRKEKIIESTSEKISFVVPGTALSEVQKLCDESDAKLSINVGTRFIQFNIGETELISRRLEGQFLNYRNAISPTFKYELDASVADLTKMFERVSLIISEKQKSPARCVFANGELTVSSATALGDANDHCYFEGDCNGMEIGFNNKYMLDVLHAVKTDKIRIKLNTNITPAIFTPCEEDNDSFIYMILPIRMKNSEN